MHQQGSVQESIADTRTTSVRGWRKEMGGGGTKARRGRVKRGVESHWQHAWARVYKTRHDGTILGTTTRDSALRQEGTILDTTTRDDALRQEGTILDTEHVRLTELLGPCVGGGTEADYLSIS